MFSTCYALSGYLAAYNWNVMWLDCLILLPLILLGAERLAREGRWVMYTVTLGLCILTNYYISIMICIFLVLYFGMLLITEYYTMTEGQSQESTKRYFAGSEDLHLHRCWQEGWLRHC